MSVIPTVADVAPSDTQDWLVETRISYDRVADSYTDILSGHLDEDPYDRGQLALFAELVTAAGGGPVADVGCGSGRITAHLCERGLDAFGLDLSPAMIARARQDHPEIRFDVGSMTDLPLGDASVAGVIAWSSVIHVPDEEVPRTLTQFHRVLRPGGVALLAFFVGDRQHHKTQGYGGHPMNVHVHHRPISRMSQWLHEAGLSVEMQMVREPHAPVPGGVLIARRP